jgi:hypothetical protein
MLKWEYLSSLFLTAFFKKCEFLLVINGFRPVTFDHSGHIEFIVVFAEAELPRLGFAALGFTNFWGPQLGVRYFGYFLFLPFPTP